MARTLDDITKALDSLSEKELVDLLAKTRLSRFTPKEVSPHKDRRPKSAAKRAAEADTLMDKLAGLSPEDLAALKAALGG